MSTSDRELKRLLGQTLGGTAPFDSSRVFETLIEEGTIDTAAPPLAGVLKVKLWLGAHCLRPTGVGVVAAAFLVALVVAISLLTPADSALARWVGQVFGIGEPGGSPTLTGQQDLRGGPWNPTQGEPLVLGVWPGGRGGGRIELVGWRSSDGQLCFAADEPTQDMNGWFCGGDSPSAEPVRAASVGTGPSRGHRMAPTILMGRVDERVVEVRLLVREGDGPGVLTKVRPMRIAAGLAQPLGSTAPFGLFLASVGSRGTVLVQGLDSEGRTVGNASVSLGRDTEGDESPIVSADSSTNKRIERKGGR